MSAQVSSPSQQHADLSQRHAAAVSLPSSSQQRSREELETAEELLKYRHSERSSYPDHHPTEESTDPLGHAYPSQLTSQAEEERQRQRQRQQHETPVHYDLTAIPDERDARTNSLPSGEQCSAITSPQIAGQVTGQVCTYGPCSFAGSRISR